MDKIRVIHCLTRVGSGGVERRRLSLASRLDPAVFEQYLLCFDAFGPLPSRFEEAGCRVIQVGPFRHIFDISKYWRAIKFVRDVKPHIVHGAVFEGIALAVVGGKFSNVPIIIAEETSVPINRSRRADRLFRLLLTASDKVVAISPAVQSYLADHCHVKRNKIDLIPNGVESPERTNQYERDSLRGDLGIDAKDYVIGTVGRIQDDQKQQSALIRGFALFFANCPQSKLLIVGDGPDIEFLKSLARSLGVSDSTIFAGYQGDTGPYFSVMDVFVLPSAYEGAPLALMEAMFCHVPLIATNIAGIPFFVKDSWSGRLLDNVEPSTISSALLDFYRNHETATLYASRAAEFAERELTAEKYVQRVADLYTKMVGQYR